MRIQFLSGALQIGQIVCKEFHLCVPSRISQLRVIGRAMRIPKYILCGGGEISQIFLVGKRSTDDILFVITRIVCIHEIFDD